MDIREQLFKQIIGQVAEGHNIMLCAPRRAGKTELAKILCETALKDKNIVHLSLNKALTENLSSRLGRKLKGYTFRTYNNLRGMTDVDCVIIEEPNHQDFAEAMDVVKALNCQMIFLFSPFSYSGKNPHPLKLLWDTAPWFKYQLSGVNVDEYYGYRRKDRYSWHNALFQTECEGNWVAY